MQKGFLKGDDAPPAACSAEELERLCASTLEHAALLRRRIDPEERPYDSRYEERELLTRLSRQAGANAARDEAATAPAATGLPRVALIGAIAEAMLGCNFMDTEEGGQARPRLEKALPVLEAASDQGQQLSLCIDTLNRLGLLASGRDEHEQSIELLNRAHTRYKAAMAKAPVAAVAAAAVASVAASAARTDSESAPAAAPAEEPAPASAEEPALVSAQAPAAAPAQEAALAPAELSGVPRIEELHTLTCFYLAQAHGNCGHREDSAAWCGRTLQRQLDAAPWVGAAAGAASAAGAAGRAGFDPYEWARNAQQLATYHQNLHDYVSAEHCLKASEVVLAAERKRRAAAAAASGALVGVHSLSEEEREAGAYLDLSFANLWLCLMRHSAAMLYDEAANKPPPPPPPQRFRLALPKPSDVCVQGRVRDAEGARKLFLNGGAHLKRAKAFFVLDGFVTDHFNVLSQETALYAALIAFEPDASRRLAMHKRRVELLEVPLAQLNRTAYAQVTRQALFDVASVRSEMVDVKAAMLEAQAAAVPLREKKLTPLVEEATQAHREFLACFVKEGKPPTKVDEESAHAYLTSRFQLARALGKLHRAEAVRESLAEYEGLIAFAEGQPVAGMEAEVAAAKEMAPLLREKCKRLEALAAR